VITLYAATTPNTLKVLFMLGEVGLPFRLERVRLYKGEQFAPEHRARHPHAKIPVIVDEEGPGGAPHTVFESGTILVYLAEKTGKLLGSTPAERSTILQWLMLQMSTLGPMLGQATHFNRVAREGNDYAWRRYVSEAVRLCETFDARLRESRFLGGEAFSIADVAAFPWLWKHPGMVGIDTRRFAGMNRWIAEIEPRPGFKVNYEQYRELVKLDRADREAASEDEVDRFFGRGRYFRV
jgi:GST-like protein